MSSRGLRAPVGVLCGFALAIPAFGAVPAYLTGVEDAETARELPSAERLRDVVKGSGEEYRQALDRGAPHALNADVRRSGGFERRRTKLSGFLSRSEIARLLLERLRAERHGGAGRQAPTRALRYRALALKGCEIGRCLQRRA